MSIRTGCIVLRNRIGCAAISLAAFFAIATSAYAQITPTESLPYEDELKERTDPRLYHVGLSLIGIRHLGGAGLGIVGSYGDRSARLSFGGEAILAHSGERRIPPEQAYNTYFMEDDGTYNPNLRYVYEEVAIIGFGGSVHSALIAPPNRVGLHAPGVTIGVSGGLMLETDRVGLRPSDLDLYYGYGSSDTDLFIRPYITPQLVMSQGALSLVCGVTVFPVFPTWSIGITYGW